MYCGNVHQVDRELAREDKPCTHFVPGPEVQSP